MMTPTPQPSPSEEAITVLRQERKALEASLPDHDAASFFDRHTRLIDEYFRRQFETSIIGPQMRIDKNPYALIALGGYGRMEQCLHSDVDLLFLFKKTVPDTAEHLIREIVYPLWDAGLDVGYATRSLKECLQLAAGELEIMTPLLDARFLCGVSLLYSDLIEQLHQKAIARRKTKIVARLIESNRLRHDHYGDSSYRLEPNLKEGKGGLRDYHTMLWLARIQYQLKQPRDLEYFGVLSHHEYQSLSEALIYIWNVRNRLHRICGRKCDQLYFENQLLLAESLGYRGDSGLQPVERFLGELHGRMDFIKQQHLMFLYELGYLTRGRPRRMPLKETRVAGLKIDKAALNFVSSETVLNQPQLLLHIFEESLRLKLPLSAEARRIVKEFKYLADEAFRHRADTVKTFERILTSPAPRFNVLKEMLDTGFLQQLIPEFKGVVNRIQYDDYHLFPVDKHLLRTVQILKYVATPEGKHRDALAHRLFKEIKNRKTLFWAALLHDIGKSDPRRNHSKTGAAIARRIMADLGQKQSDVDLVEFLVLEHLYLIKIATRRDIHSEETAIACARRIETVERLKMLYLLAVVDSMATGPKAWNDWTATLLKDLFFKIFNILAKGELASQEAVREMEMKRQRVLVAAMDPAEHKEISRLFDILSPRYLLYATSDQILEDLARYKRLGDLPFVWNVTRSAASETRTVKVCAHDRPGLFASIAGVFTLNNIDIVDAQIFTWRNQIAVDVFEVIPPPDRLFEEERWERAEQNLIDALRGKLDLNSALYKRKVSHRKRKAIPPTRPHRIVVDNDSSSFFTIVEVVAYDYPGLLFDITDALFGCRLDIWVAKIATRVDQVVDVFYVRDFDGQKADSPEQETAIRKSIERHVLSGKPPAAQPNLPGNRPADRFLNAVK